MYLSRHLLWKDYRQAAPGLVGCWAILIVLIALDYVRHFSSSVPSTFYSNGLMLTLVSPTLAAMACTGLLFGQERQTGSWNWSSSLPISWQSALLSKTLLWLLSSILMLSTLLAIHFLLLALFESIGAIQSVTEPWYDLRTGFLTAVVLPLEVYICFSLSVLLINETLPAMVSAGVLVSILHFGLAEVAPAIFTGESTIREHFIHTAIGVSLIALIVVLGGGSVLLNVYRWRWGTGQSAVVRSPLAAAESLAVPAPPSIWQHFGLVTRQPGQTKMLLWHGITAALGFRLIVAGFATALIIVLNPTNDGYVPTIFVVAGLLGLSVFSGDQPRNRFRFLSDRGVTWWKLLAAHAAMPTLLLLLVWGAWLVKAAIWPEMVAPYGIVYEPALILAISYLLFMAGVCCSLCVTSQLLALCLLAATVTACIFTMAMNEFLWQYVALAPPFPIWKSLVVMIGPPVALIFLIRRWLVRESIPVRRFLVATVLLGLVLPFALEITTSYLLVPKYSWKGLPIDTFRATASQPTRQLPGALEALPTARAIQEGWMRNAFQSTDQFQIWLAATDEEGLVVNDQQRENLTSELSQLAAKVDAFAAEGAGLAHSHVDLIRASSYWGYVATTRLRDPEMAITAWRLNKKLCALIDYRLLENSFLVEARSQSNIARGQLSPGDWSWLAARVDLNELINEPPPIEELKQVLQVAGTWKYGYLFAKNEPAAELSKASPAKSNLQRNLVAAAQYVNLGGIRVVDYARPAWANTLIQYVPPLRWNLQRQASVELQMAMDVLDHTDSQATTFPNGWVYFHSSPMVQLLFREKFLKQYIEQFKPASQPSGQAEEKESDALEENSGTN